MRGTNKSAEGSRRVSQARPVTRNKGSLKGRCESALKAGRGRRRGKGKPKISNRPWKV
jgi:hypothetical protein